MSARDSACLLLMAFVSCSAPSSTEALDGGEPAPADHAATRALPAPVEQPHWSYRGDDGPDAWGRLAPEWAPCAVGHGQSPIDLSGAVARPAPALHAAYGAAKLAIAHNEHTADIVNTGHAVQVSSPRGDVLTLGRDSYELLQFHFHTPSEHTVNGQRFPLEAHFVHRAPDGRLAVVAVLFRAGAPNAGLRPVVERLPARKGVEFHYEHLETDASYFLPKDRTTFRYEGSLTTPPCTEGVAWVVFASPVSASVEQIAALRRASGTNSRPRQAAFGRSVTVERLGEPAL